jgi:hypothetical protein
MAHAGVAVDGRRRIQVETGQGSARGARRFLDQEVLELPKRESADRISRGDYSAALLPAVLLVAAFLAGWPLGFSRTCTPCPADRLTSKSSIAVTRSTSFA